MSQKDEDFHELTTALIDNNDTRTDSESEDFNRPTAPLLKKSTLFPATNYDLKPIPPMSKKASNEEKPKKSRLNDLKNDDNYHYQKTIVSGRYLSEDMRFGIGKNSIPNIPIGGADAIKWNAKLEGMKNNSGSTTNIIEMMNNSMQKQNYARRKSATIEKPHGMFRRLRLNIVKFLVEDWLYLALLGVIMAVCSLSMDICIEHLQEFHIIAVKYVQNLESPVDNIIYTYLVWITYGMFLVTVSAVFVHYIAPQAIGSGIPEMKTILRGVILKEYLTLRTLISKMIGLTLSLGSGMPIGKEGPFVHIASVLANLLSNFVHNSSEIYSNESRKSEMLAAGAAVGVACTFSAPVGGVLFSIEVTSVYFAVRNYWRGFFAAACSATLFRLLRVVLTASEVTVVAFYQTNFPRDAFFPEEMLVFAAIGICAGFGAAVFIYVQREIVLFLRKDTFIKKFFTKYWIVYPIFISFIISSLTYPKGYGQFIAGEKKFSATLKDFFKNCTWSAHFNSSNSCGPEFLKEWTGPDLEYNVFYILICYLITYFFLSALASTLPIPSGIFMPVFVIGACFGRTIGEGMALWFPDGLRGAGDVQIYPGIYAVVGAAAFCGGVTHTVSVAVIVFELTGQLMYILPVMLAVLLSNAVCSYLQPSIYDSIIKIKHLPYLPDIPATSSYFHGIRVEQFMIRKIEHLSQSSSYGEIQDLLLKMPRMKAFPVVENNQSMILLGSCSRANLLMSLQSHVGVEARKIEANARVQQEICEANRRMNPKMMIPDYRQSILNLDFDFKPQRNLKPNRPEIGGFKDDEKPALLLNTFVDNTKKETSQQKRSNYKNNITMSLQGAVSPPVSRFTIVPVPAKVEDNNELKANHFPTRSSTRSNSPVIPWEAMDTIQKDDETMYDELEVETEEDKNHLSINRQHSKYSIHSLLSNNSVSEVYNTIGGYIRSIQKISFNRFGKKSAADGDYDLDITIDIISCSSDEEDKERKRMVEQ
uniref:Chloride channel protein n=1 Tax=Rhabditophanes sp. KR3021 TaxID=114890 RepID=A0AC35U8C5_9BILA